MNVLWMTDLHLSENDKLGIIENGINSRLEEKKRFLQQVVNHCLENSIDMVIDGGDIFDPRTSSVSAELRQIYVDNFIRPCVEMKQPVRIIGTNHGSDGDFNALGAEALLFPEFIKLITKPGREVFKEKTPDEMIFWYIPYGFDVPSPVYDTPDKSIIWGHFGLEGLYPDPHAITVEQTKIKKAIVGHTHNEPEKLKESKIWYSGASFPNNFGEIENFGRGRFWQLTFKENKIIPTTVYFPDVNPLMYFIITPDKLEGLSIADNAIVKIKIKGKKSEITKFSVEYIKTLYPQIKELYLEYQATEDSDFTTGTSTEFTPEEIITGLTFGQNKDNDYLEYGLIMIGQAKEFIS